MDRIEAQTEINNMLLSYGLIQKGWVLQLPGGEGVTRASYTDYETRTIRITKGIVRDFPWEDIRRLVLHELAHIFVGPDVAPHGVEWTAMCWKLGIPPQRLFKGLFEMEGDERKLFENEGNIEK